MKGQSYIISALVFAVIVAIFAVINVDPVEVNYLFGTGNAPLILVILISVLLGGIITASVGLFRMVQLKREVKQLRKQNKEMETRMETNDYDHREPTENQESPSASAIEDDRAEDR